MISLITNPFRDKVNPALGAPLSSVPLLKVNHPLPLSHHTVQPVGGGVDTNLGFRKSFGSDSPPKESEW